MGCIACSSSAPVCSSNVIYPVVSLRSQNSDFFLERLVSLRSSPTFRNSSFSLKISASVSSSAPIVVRNDEDFSSSPNPGYEESGNQNLSAKERRKLRNERREAAKSSQEQPWKEMVQDRLDKKKKKVRSWQEDADINRCIEKGVQWWMIQTTRKYEADVAEQISRRFPARFPGREFQVIVPTVPVKTKLKDGSVSQSRKKLYEGIVLLRCLLDRDVYVMVKTIPRAYEFFGNQAGLRFVVFAGRLSMPSIYIHNKVCFLGKSCENRITHLPYAELTVKSLLTSSFCSLQPIVMPAPVSNYNMDVMFQKIRKQEGEYEEFKEQCRRELEEEKKEKQRKDKEQQRWDDEQKLLKSKSLVLEVGATVRVLSGAFVDFTGVVIELLSNNKIKALVTVFGNDTPIVLDVEEVVVEATPGSSKRRTMKNP